MASTFSGATASRAKIREHGKQVDKNKRAFIQLTNRRNRVVYNSRELERLHPLKVGKSTMNPHFDRGAPILTSNVDSPTQNPLADTVMLETFDVEEGDVLMLKIAEEKQKYVPNNLNLPDVIMVVLAT